MPEVYITIPNIPVTLSRRGSQKALREAIREALDFILDVPDEVVCWVHPAEVQEHGCLDCMKPVKTTIAELDMKIGDKQNVTRTT